MFAHVTVGALDIELSRKFYDATFVELTIKPGGEEITAAKRSHLDDLTIG